MSDNENSDIESIISEDEEEQSESIIPKNKNFNLKKTFKNQEDSEGEGEDEEDEDEDPLNEETDDNIEESDYDDEIEKNIQTTTNVDNVDNIGFAQENLASTLIIPDQYESGSDVDSDEDEYDDENYLEKFDSEMRDNYILDHHPEDKIHNVDEINALCKIKRNNDNIIIDDLHRTIPILTKYEKSRVLGIRAKQLNNGSNPYIKLERPIIDSMLIAIKELQERKLPFIIRRPIPNGGFEYWPLNELEVV